MVARTFVYSLAYYTVSSPSWHGQLRHLVVRAGTSQGDLELTSFARQLPRVNDHWSLHHSPTPPLKYQRQPEKAHQTWMCCWASVADGGQTL